MTKTEWIKSLIYELLEKCDDVEQLLLIQSLLTQG